MRAFDEVLALIEAARGRAYQAIARDDQRPWPTGRAGPQVGRGAACGVRPISLRFATALRGQAWKLPAHGLAAALGRALPEAQDAAALRAECAASLASVAGDAPRLLVILGARRRAEPAVGSEGDPLLVRLYLDALITGPAAHQLAWMTPADLPRIPPGLDGWL